MPRILYNVVTQGAVAGGYKMAFRHVETLRELGFDAVCYLAGGSVAPTWFEHKAPVEVSPRVHPDDILVVADDAVQAITNLRSTAIRTVIFSQNPYFFAAWSFDALDRYPPERFPSIIAVSQGSADLIGRAYPDARIAVVPCFADERLFRPGDKRFAAAYVPRKRPAEAGAIQGFFRRIHPRHADLDWTELHGVSETAVAEAFAGSALHLSLSRLESVGMTTLEAMASGCVCAGFTGVGGQSYATAENGFWVPEDDCEAASDALAAAADLVRSGGPALAAYVEAGQETARQWSYARFRDALEASWMQLAPGMRKSSGPLPYPG